MPFLGARGQCSKGYFGGAATPHEPYIGTISTSIGSPAKVGTPSMSQDDNNASFSWSSPGATGVALSVPFTVPSFDGGLSITNYEYSTDDGSTWKSAGTTTSPINITTVSSSSSALSSSTTYTIKLRAVNALGTGSESLGVSKTTLDQVTSYTIRVYDNYPTQNELVETITGNTSGTYSRSHYHEERNWSITVRAVNSNGSGAYSDESAEAHGWIYSGYDASYGTTQGCTTDSGCESCGTRNGWEDGTVAQTCYRWTRDATVHNNLNCVTGGTTWQGNCRDTGACSGSWVTVTVENSGRPDGNYWVDYAYGNSPRLINFNSMYAFTDVDGCNVCNCPAENTAFYDIQRCTVTGAYRWTSMTCYYVGFGW